MNIALKHYETIFILTPVLSEPQIQEMIDKFSGFLSKKKAEIVHEERLGLRKLAYPIEHKSTGIYYLIEFKAAPEVISALEIEYRREGKVIRFLTASLDKHGVDYNNKRRNNIVSSLSESKKEVIA